MLSLFIRFQCVDVCTRSSRFFGRGDYISFWRFPSFSMCALRRVKKEKGALILTSFYRQHHHHCIVCALSSLLGLNSRETPHFSFSSLHRTQNYFPFLLLFGMLQRKSFCSQLNIKFIFFLYENTFLRNFNANGMLKS